MIWTRNHGQTPAGCPVAAVTIGGRSSTVWRGNGGHLAFVADSGVSSGRLNLLAFFRRAIARGWPPADSTLSQVDYGLEIVSTGHVPVTFGFSDFGVTAGRRAGPAGAARV
jgi:hypothetical protein